MQYYVVSDELYHHGILGMKWGVRRYQNKNGSLTPLGYHRYGKEVKAGVKRFNEAAKEYDAAKKSKNRPASKAAKKAMKTEYKNIERQASIDRGKVLVENRHQNLLTLSGKSLAAHGAVTIGRAATKSVLDMYGSDPATQLVSKTAQAGFAVLQAWNIVSTSKQMRDVWNYNMREVHRK